MPDTFDFTVVLEPQPEGGFTVSVLEYRRDHGMPIPDDAQPRVRKITVAA